jgi:hypothetical protein
MTLDEKLAWLIDTYGSVLITADPPESAYFYTMKVSDYYECRGGAVDLCVDLAYMDCLYFKEKEASSDDVT